MLSLFKDTAGGPYWPSILTFTSWLLTGIIIFVGFAIAQRYRDKTNREKLALASKVSDAVAVGEILRNYSEVAKLNLIGKPYVDGDIVYTSPLSKALEGSYKMEGSRVEFFSTEASVQIHLQVIEKYRHFPFSYCVMATILRAKEDASWKDYAVQAKEILEKTIQIGGHHPNHDQELAKIGKVLSQ